MSQKSFDEWSCTVGRSLTVVGERWMLLIIREALLGTTRFVEFQTSLGIAPDMLSSRLATLVDYAVMIKRAYQEPGQRARPEYHLTPAGRELRVVIAALQQWGDRHLPRPQGPTMTHRAHCTDRPVHVAFIDDLGYEVAADDVATISTCPAELCPRQDSNLRHRL